MAIEYIKKVAKNLSRLLPKHLATYAQDPTLLSACQELAAQANGFPDFQTAVSKSRRVIKQANSLSHLLPWHLTTWKDPAALSACQELAARIGGYSSFHAAVSSPTTVENDIEEESSIEKLSAWFEVLHRLMSIQHDNPFASALSPEPLRDDLADCVRRSWVRAWKLEGQQASQLKLAITPEGRDIYTFFCNELEKQGRPVNPRWDAQPSPL